ncbi:Mitochondrial proton/calcium exchanger protein [Camellia lanceoleosa]|uniref:Mitochondrial proton/calcium exchanger protein n=1 Tax=Camellia lanceoleosa TaxID=1840588 RepID=A0ACC0F3E3_9ERIC|nr:Mitochondrial proton/calcium exchanger protein [Camellia lanceoleosa]
MALLHPDLQGGSFMGQTVPKDMWMGSHLLFIDILDTMGLLMKKLRGNKVTKRERRKIERTLADIASLIPITILMLLPCWTTEKVEYEMDMVESAVKSLRSLRALMPAKERHER